MIRLETVKNRYFLDYAAVEKYLAVPRSRVETLSLRTKSDDLDSATSPLSLSSINNPSSEVVFIKEGTGLKRLFTNLQNRYYPQIQLRQQRQHSMQEELDRERLMQISQLKT